MEYKDYENNYTTKLPLPPRPNKPVLRANKPEDYRAYADELEKYNAELKVYDEALEIRRKDQRKLDEQYKLDSFEHIGIADHPKREILWQKAMDSSRDEGMYQVYLTAQSLSDLLS